MHRRKWVIALTLASALICGAALVFYLLYWPKMLARNTALIAYVVEEGLEGYHEDHQSYPEGTAAQIIAALLGENTRKKSYLRPDFRQLLDASGDVVDSWKRPFRFDKEPDGSLKVRSAGPNGTFDDEDDLTSDKLEESG